MATQQFSLMSFSSFNNDFDLMKNWISALLKSNRPICMIIESELSFYDKLDSSVKNENFFFDFDNSSIIIFSTFLSALVTKSDGPFKETCKFSNSPKSLINDLEAFSAALIIIFKFGEIEFIIMN